MGGVWTEMRQPNYPEQIQWAESRRKCLKQIHHDDWAVLRRTWGESISKWEMRLSGEINIVQSEAIKRTDRLYVRYRGDSQSKAWLMAAGRWSPVFCISWLTLSKPDSKASLNSSTKPLRSAVGDRHWHCRMAKLNTVTNSIYGRPSSVISSSSQLRFFSFNWTKLLLISTYIFRLYQIIFNYKK